MMKTAELMNEKPWLGWLLFGGALAAVFLLGLFATTIMERRAEARKEFRWITPLGGQEPDSSVWGKNFPREYQTWLETRDTSFRSRYNGGAPRDMLEEHPVMVVLWAGYGFAKDYDQGRGHYYSVTDVRETLRTGPAGSPGTCWTCKSSDVPRMMNQTGAAEFYRAEWAELGPEIRNPIGCLDCHDPETMNLRVSRPALIEAFERQGKDIAAAAHQEMRSLVCAQCHAEYYFKKPGDYLTFPWDKGTSAEEMEAYYDERGFHDWVHALSKTPLVKPQHPDWELFQAGIHARRGLACADCHMPYRSEGGVKFTNHKVQSPLNNIANTCQVCHRESEEELRRNVYERQDKLMEIRNRTEQALLRAHLEAGKAWELRATEKEMEPVLKLIRQAQWRWDFVAASHGAPFHAPIESVRIMSASLQRAMEARLVLARLLSAKGFAGEAPVPDLSTKAKAQAFIGLNMDALQAEKKAFIKERLPEWEK